MHLHPFANPVAFSPENPMADDKPKNDPTVAEKLLKARKVIICEEINQTMAKRCLLYTSPSPRDS